MEFGKRHDTTDTTDFSGANLLRTCCGLVSKQVSDLYSAKVSEENQGALGMGARGQGRLTESSGLCCRLAMGKSPTC